MAKFRQTGNCRSNKLGGRNIGSRYSQIVYSEPQKLFIGVELTKKGKRLLAESDGSLEVRKTIFEKYGKKRYAHNENAVPVKTIYHIKNK